MRHLVICLILLGIAGALILAGRGGHEPVFEGKPLDLWLDNGFEDASRAVHEIGPTAAPGIFAKLKREHPRYGYWHRYRQVWETLPPFCRKTLPKPKTGGFDEWRASCALAEIGPRVIPPLARSLESRDFLVRITSAQALGFLRLRGMDIGAAAPALLKASGDSDPEVRRHASAALRLFRERDAASSGSSPSSFLPAQMPAAMRNSGRSRSALIDEPLRPSL